MKTIILVAIVIALTGCWQTGPKIIDGESMACFQKRDCLYRNQKNTDKSACSSLIKSCNNILEFNKKKEIIKYCETKKINGMTENECRLFMK